jgi:SAM-dependent methyltransferase
MTIRPTTAMQETRISRDFGYSDGDETEEHLLACLRSCSDVGVFSGELRKHISDWPSEYHFSAVRHNLLRPFSFRPGMRILELGCGCGAITRYLGETGATVIAVEGSARRAEIARERCRDLPNVQVLCANLVNYHDDQQFDHVLLIGVLEYAQQYVAAPDPVRACLEHAGSLLTESGTLFLAIENQLGLKYFNGCDEDHIGIPYYGVQGLYTNDGPRTFGKRALSQRLETAGFRRQTFFYPFPDYKLPNIIIAESALTHPEFSIASLLCRSAADNRHGRFAPAFFENMAWPAIAENCVLGELANSFLVLAGKHDTGAPLDWLACTYTAERLPRYATETRFICTDGCITVVKRPLWATLSSSVAEMPCGELQHIANETSDYVPGEIYLIGLQRILARGGDLDELVAWADEWMALLAPQVRLENGVAILDGGMLDAIPSNLIRRSDGTLHLIDHEWLVTAPVPLAWVLVRGLLSAIAASPASPKLARLTYREVMSRVAERLMQKHGWPSTDLFDETNALENALRTIVFDKITPENMITSALDKPVTGLIHREASHENEKKALRAEIDRIKSTVSWQITKPLRLMANLPRLTRRWLKSSGSL